MTTRRTRRAATSLISFLILAALIGGFPAALYTLAGSPLPHVVPSLHQVTVALTRQDQGTLVLATVRCVSWLAWALFAISALIELFCQARDRTVARLPVISWIQGLAAPLVSAALVSLLTSPQPPGLASLPPRLAQAVATAPPSPAQPAGAPATVAFHLGFQSGRAAGGRAAPDRTRYRVVPGDNLWDVAARRLGNGEDWHEIFAINKDKPQPDGQELTDPNLIRPGWILEMPPLPPGNPIRHVHAGRPHPHRFPRACAPAPSPSPPPSGTPTSPRPSSTATARRPATHSRSAHRDHPIGGIRLPSGAVVSLSLASAVALAVAAARLHRRRWREPYAVPGAAPPEQPLGPALRQVRRAHLAVASTPQLNGDGDPADLPGPLADSEGLPPREEPSTETIAVAARDGADVFLGLGSARGIGVTGPGAAATIRAIMVSVLARRTTHQGEVLLSDETASRLLASGGGEPVTGEIPGLAMLPGAQDVLSHLEAEILHRRRLLDAAGIDDLDAYRTNDRSEHLPTILVIAPPGGPSASRLAAVLVLGQRLGIAGILTGSWPPGATCEVAADGHITQVSDGLRLLEGARMFQLTPGDAAEMLAALAAGNGARQPAEPDLGAARILPAPPGPGSALKTQARPVQFAILGPFQLGVGGEPISKGLRRKGAELLVYLALHPDGATTDAILEAVWPGTVPTRAAVSLHTVTTNIRKILREATGAGEAGFIVRVSDHLKIDHHLIDCDLWQFSAALVTAAAAPDDQARRTALEQATVLWRGDLADGIDAVWIEEARETLRRDQVDALARLAQLTENDEPEPALAALERAIIVDRYQEALYRRIMTIQGTLSRPDAARRTYQLLESRLAELDAEPDESTVRLLHGLLRREST